VAVRQAMATATVNVDDLGNVTAPSPSNKQILIWNGSAWVNAVVPAKELDDLLNVDLTSPTYRHLIQYDASSGSWVNVSPSDIRPELNDLVDIDITSPVDGSFLRYEDSSGSWKDGTADLNDLANVTAPSPNDGDGIYFDDGTSKWVSGTPTAGSEAEAPLQHVFNEDITSSGSNHETAYAFITNSLAVHWNGVRQSSDYFTENAGSGFTTTFYVEASDELLVDYVRSTSGSLGVWNGDASKLVGRKISAASPTEGQVLTWNSTAGQWEPQTP
jgi:hypothetical protein